MTDKVSMIAKGKAAGMVEGIGIRIPFAELPVRSRTCNSRMDQKAENTRRGGGGGDGDGLADTHISSSAPGSQDGKRAAQWHREEGCN